MCAYFAHYLLKFEKYFQRKPVSFESLVTHILSLLVSVKTDLTVALGRPLVELLRSSDTQVQKAATLAVSNFCLTGAGKNIYILDIYWVGFFTCKCAMNMSSFKKWSCDHSVLIRNLLLISKVFKKKICNADKFYACHIYHDMQQRLSVPFDVLISLICKLNHDTSVNF